MRRVRRIEIAFVALAALALAGAYGAARLKRFVDDDPRLCAQCHRASPEFAIWNSGSHRSVACQRCHHASTEEGLAMLRAFLAGKSPDGKKPHARIEVGACAQCHLSHDSRWPQLESSRGHRLHVVERGITCVQCHAAGMHGFQPVVSSCRGCHGEHAVRVTGMAKLHCFTCHNFLEPGPGLRPTRRDCLRCHRAEGVLPARFEEGAPMQFECRSCHKPHAPPDQELVGCASCHPASPTAGLHAARGHARCGDCHVAHQWKAEDGGCLRCHAGARAHAVGRACGACHAFAEKRSAGGARRRR